MRPHPRESNFKFRWKLQKWKRNATNWTRQVRPCTTQSKSLPIDFTIFKKQSKRRNGLPSTSFQNRIKWSGSNNNKKKTIDYKAITVLCFAWRQSRITCAVIMLIDRFYVRPFNRRLSNLYSEVLLFIGAPRYNECARQHNVFSPPYSSGLQSSSKVDTNNDIRRKRKHTPNPFIIFLSSPH